MRWLRFRAAGKWLPGVRGWNSGILDNVMVRPLGAERDVSMPPVLVMEHGTTIGLAR